MTHTQGRDHASGRRTGKSTVHSVHMVAAFVVYQVTCGGASGGRVGGGSVALAWARTIRQLRGTLSEGRGERRGKEVDSGGEDLGMRFESLPSPPPRVCVPATLA